MSITSTLFLLYSLEVNPPLNSLGAVIVVTHQLICRKMGFSMDFPEEDLFGLNLRNVIVAMNQLYFCGMFFYLPMPTVNTLALTGTLFIFVIDYFKFGVPISKLQLQGLILGAVGVIFTINGPFMMLYFDPDYKAVSDFKHYKTDSNMVKLLLALGYIAM